MPKIEIFSRRITEAYEQVFSEQNDDIDRLLILAFAIQGSVVSPAGESLKLEDALSSAPEDSKEATQYRAISALRAWYLHPDRTSQEDIESTLKEAGMEKIITTLPDCLKVLATARKSELTDAFYAALRANTKIAVLAAFETLYNSGHQDLADLALTMTAEYFTKGKYQCPFVEFT